ncbi:MAG TPA: AIR synthase-related protein, partial [Aggregatilineales bacterium]|nr:AIR synthase-related protein [Aggregatilineales bacterium]
MHHTTFCIGIFPRTRATQYTENRLVSLAHQLGIHSLTGCSIARLFFIQGEIDAHDLHPLVNDILVDPVTEIYQLSDPDQALPAEASAHFIDISYLPGVTDTVAENLLHTARQIGLRNITQAATGWRYLLDDPLTENELQHLATKAFSNPTIQSYAIDHPITPPFMTLRETPPEVEKIPILDADSTALLDISSKRRLSLDLAEMQAIQGYYQTQERNPTDVELEMLAQTWSEHCVHKTFKANISYTEITHEGESLQETIHGLLNTYIRGATEQIHKDWIRSTFVDNAGIIAFDEKWDLAFKVETHNHPSAIEPFGGANTGLGGVIRDILGVSARPIASTDVLCFGYHTENLPAGTLHPRRIEDGVVHGIEDYGNKMGIPTVNGAVLYHAGYTANPLVFCGSLGILPHGSHPTQPQSGDLIIVIGGRTGRDGLRGATFSSMEMNSDTGTIAGSAVQIGHPINEKQVLEVILQARDEKLYNAITDCGAGGLSSAVGEMSADLGATVQLRDVPLKYAGLLPWEIWLSEAQERMVLAVPSENWSRLQEICELHDIEAVCIGTFENSGHLKLYY